MLALYRTAICSTFGLLVIGTAQSQTPPTAPASPVLEQTAEYRFQLDMHVNDAALAKLLPAGWEANVAATGAAKDCNIRLIFIDAVNVVGPDNKILGKGSNRLAYLAAPIKQTGGTMTGQMILGGISEESGLPEAFSVYVKSSRANVTHSAAAINGAVTVTEDWDLAAASGEHVQMHVKYLRGSPARGASEVKFFNPADPSKYQIFKSEQGTDVTRNVTTTPPDRVQEFSLHAGGGKFAALFDGSEKPLSWDSQPTYSRVISAP